MLAHPEGELATAKGAGMSKTILIMSTPSNYTLEEAAEVATWPLWFQLYHRGKELTEMLVRRAEKAGYKVLCLTVDTPAASPKERDIRNRFARVGDEANFREVGGAATRPPGSRRGVPSGSIPITWKELEWLRSLSSMPLVLKGIRTAEDAALAVEHGVDGIFVSNHGGRQMDMTLSAIETLPEIVDAVKGRAEVYLDSGIRRGSDVIKAMALGARAVAIGRPFYWGLAVDGAEGVHGVLEILREEIDRCMAFCGQTNIRELEPGLVAIPNGWGPGTFSK
jgi:4-hydroxymandelate oxidase